MVCSPQATWIIRAILEVIATFAVQRASCGAKKRVRATDANHRNPCYDCLLWVIGYVWAKAVKDLTNVLISTSDKVWVCHEWFDGKENIRDRVVGEHPFELTKLFRVHIFYWRLMRVSLGALARVSVDPGCVAGSADAAGPVRPGGQYGRTGGGQHCSGPC